MLFNGAEINGAAINASGIGYVLTADAGAYSVTGNDATLFIGYVLSADTSAFAITGRDALLVLNTTLQAQAGYYATAISEANFNTGYQIQADTANYLINGIQQAFDVGVLQLAVGREISVPTESRTLMIEKENRVISAGGPDSAIIVGTERRTINVLKERA